MTISKVQERIKNLIRLLFEQYGLDVNDRTIVADMEAVAGNAVICLLDLMEAQQAEPEVTREQAQAVEDVSAKPLREAALVWVDVGRLAEADAELVEADAVVKTREA